MRKRILIALITLLIVCASIITIASASDSESSGYAYQVYNPNNNTVTKYIDGDYLNVSLSEATDGCIITLLDDVVETKHWTTVGATGTADNLTDIYLDLNGYTLTCAGLEEKQLFFYIQSYVNFNVYSSREGGTIVHTENNEGGLSHGLFELRLTGATLHLGEVVPPVTLPSLDGITPTVASDKATYSGVTPAANTGACSGSNLTVYASTLLSSVDTYDNIRTTYIYIDGGTYVQTAVGWRPAFIMAESDATLLAKNASFIAPDKLFLTTAHGSIDKNGDTTMQTYKFQNCLIYTDTLLREASSKIDFTFSDCRLLCNKLLEANANSGVVKYENCLIDSNVSAVEAADTIVTREESTITVPSIAFSYVDGILVKNDYAISTDTASVLYGYTTDTSTPHATVTWVDLAGNTSTQKYATGKGIIPNATAMQVPPSTDIYKYSFYPRITEVTEDITYTLKPTANFILKSNIELHTDFVYKIYIPTELVTSEYVDSIKVDSVTPTFSETKVIEGKEHYVIRSNIKAPEAMGKTIDLSIAVHTAEGFDFEQKYALSIPDYADRVNAGAFSENAKALVNSVIKYVKAAYDYYNPTAENKYEPEVTAVAGAQHSGNKGAAEGIVYGVDISTNECVKFRFYVYSDAVTNGTKLTFRYQDRNAYTTLTVSEFTGTNLSVYENNTERKLSYCEITTRAMDIRDTIEVSVGATAKATPDFTYELANYIYYINSTNTLENVEYLRTMMYALWDYSACAERYMLNTDSDSPMLSISINGNVITKDGYAIVANTADSEEYAAAEAIRDAILVKTGIELNILTEKVAGKNCIYVNPTVPTTKYDFTVATDGADLVVNCSYSSFIERATEDFVKEYVLSQDESYDFSSSFVANYYTDKIYYSDFGAVGNADTSLLTNDLSGNAYEISEKPEVFANIKSTNGWVNDFEAIKKAHDVANETKRHTVYADAGKTYYMGSAKIDGSYAKITIKTNVVWTNAEFIIDDTVVNPNDSSSGYNYALFSVEPDRTNIRVTDRAVINAILEKGLNPDTKNIDLGYGYPVMIIPNNESHKVYRRRGYSDFQGHNMHEIIVLDENGNVSAETPIMFTYTDISYIDIVDLRETPITIEGGNITTVACHVDVVNRDENGNITSGVNATYVNRGMSITRSGTTLSKLNHYVVGEITVAQEATGMRGVRYAGFYYMTNASDITLTDCLLTSRRCYGFNRDNSNGGTYEYSAGRINNLVFNNCIQTNFWVDGSGKAVAEGTAGAKLSMSSPSEEYSAAGTQMYWGTGNSNYCKNMKYIGSTLSRFDAHEGLYNGAIIDSTVNFISLIGGGDMLIENTRWFTQANSEQESAVARALIYLRDDYGCTWNGTITIKNVSGYTHADKPIYLFYHSYSNWYYGYKCYFPNVSVDGLKYYNINNTSEEISSDTTVIFSSSNSLIANSGIHSSQVSSIAPRYTYVDTNGDGFVDRIDCNGNYIGETSVAYISGNVSANYNGVNDGNEPNLGTAASPKYQNINPIAPPSKVVIKNSDYNWDIPYTASFFDGTYISINGTVLKYKTNPYDAPIVDYIKK